MLSNQRAGELFGKAAFSSYKTALYQLGMPQTSASSTEPYRLSTIGFQLAQAIRDMRFTTAANRATDEAEYRALINTAHDLCDRALIIPDSDTRMAIRNQMAQLNALATPLFDHKDPQEMEEVADRPLPPREAPTPTPPPDFQTASHTAVPGVLPISEEQAQPTLSAAVLESMAISLATARAERAQRQQEPASLEIHDVQFTAT
jgi:hypothetical protein